jgi:hypothetical protein
MASNPAWVRPHTQQFCLRMLGQNVQMARWQWETLLEDLQPESNLAHRIRGLLEIKTPAMASVRGWLSR